MNTLSKRNFTIHTKSGDLEPPFFMPIATKGAVKNLLPSEIHALGAQIILGNTYHLWLRPGDNRVREAGDLHDFSRWSSPILTDSGGYQVFSLGEKILLRGGKSSVIIEEDGVHFRDPSNGAAYYMTPEKSIDIQLNLGSDIIMVLDECPPYPCSYDYAARSVGRTTRWARRCLEYLNRQLEQRGVDSMSPRPLIFCIVQGSLYEDLRKRSAQELLALEEDFSERVVSGWDGFAIGGVAVGEPREKLNNVLTWTLPYLPKDKPRYLMGLGRPDELVSATRKGVDMFDCVIPTREGRHGRVFAWKDDWRTGDLSGEFFITLQLTNEKFRADDMVIDQHCDCTACSQGFTRSFIRHQFSVGEPLAGRLTSLHNLRFYMQLMERLGKERTQKD